MKDYFKNEYGLFILEVLKSVKRFTAYILKVKIFYYAEIFQH